MKTNESFILSYIKGTLSASEMNECDNLMNTSSEFALKVNQIKKTYYLFDNLEAQREVDTDFAWQKLHKKIRFDKGRKVIWNFSRNAAAILLPLFLIIQFVVQPILKEAPKQEIITLYSAPGIVAKAVLPDGSVVWLNSQSELTYPRVFQGNERTVQLIGEAYFKVVSDDKNRFNVVTADKTVVSAYGTEFNVNAYSEDSQYTITLTKGNLDVLLTNLSLKQTITPNQKVVVDKHSDNFKVLDTDTYVETAWKDGKTVFRRENIVNIASKLSRKFGVKIVVEGNVSKDYQFTATFTDESLEEVLELLKLSTSVDYSISKQQKLQNDTVSQRIITLICK